MGRTTSYAYDSIGRRTKVFNTAIQAAPLLQRAYTPDGLAASLTDANSNTTSFAYDGFDRLATVTYPLGSTEIFTYDPDGNVLTRKTRANQTLAFEYDGLNRLTKKTPPTPAPVVNYTYDLAGRLRSVSDTSAAIASALPPSPATSVLYTTSYGYDSLNRPTAVNFNPAPAAVTPTTGAAATFTHTYNKASQRSGQTTTDNSWWQYPTATPSTVSYTANALNQYTAVGAATPSYDGNGNLTGDGTFTFGYDAENRLAAATGAGNTASYAYDAQGRRKSKTVNGATMVFVTDADNREVMEYDGASGQVSRWYAYGLGPNAVLGQMNVAAGTRLTLIPDMLGSIVGTFDATSGTLTKIGYLPYGGSGSIVGTFRYTGQRIDAETGGLYYYRARMYSANSGRFMQSDLIGYAGGLNLYAYLGNDPLNSVDSTGLSPDTPQQVQSSIKFAQQTWDQFQQTNAAGTQFTGGVIEIPTTDPPQGGAGMQVVSERPSTNNLQSGILPVQTLANQQAPVYWSNVVAPNALAGTAFEPSRYRALQAFDFELGIGSVTPELQLAGTKSTPYRCVNCSAPTGGVFYPYCPDCYKKSLDPKGEVAPIPKIIDPRKYQE
jgi:RHS repeat-associated protein